MQHGKLPEGWDKDLPNFPADAKGMATRDSSGKALNALAKNIPWMIGGSADLAHSNKTNLTFEGAGDFFPGQYHGRNLHFGVREHAMGAIVNGLSVSQLRAFSATFFNFSDYMRAEHAACGAHGSAFHLHFHARFDRTWEKMARRISPSNSWLGCAPCRT